jgi:hypothetical protein
MNRETGFKINTKWPDTEKLSSLYPKSGKADEREFCGESNKFIYIFKCHDSVQFIFIMTLWNHEPLTRDSYVFPEWSIAVGWILTTSSLMWIPIYMVYKLIITPGSFMEVLYAEPSISLQGVLKISKYT